MSRGRGGRRGEVKSFPDNIPECQALATSVLMSIPDPSGGDAERDDIMNRLLLLQNVTTHMIRLVSGRISRKDIPLVAPPSALSLMASAPIMKAGPKKSPAKKGKKPEAKAKAIPKAALVALPAPETEESDEDESDGDVYEEVTAPVVKKEKKKKEEKVEVVSAKPAISSAAAGADAALREPPKESGKAQEVPKEMTKSWGSVLLGK